MKTSIIILTYNKLEFTKQCIESIREYTLADTYELIIVDNCSNDGTIEWLKEQSDIKVIFNKENLGFPKGCNQGIEISTGDNILLLNNDVIVTENWLSNLTTALYSQEDVGAVGPITNSAAYYTAISTSYNTLAEMHDFARTINQISQEKWEERLKLIGFCMLIKKEAIDKIGYLDERFTPGNFEDDDYSIRLRKRGYKLLLCRDTFIHHYGSVSWRDNVEGYSQLMSDNEKKFMGKWGTNSYSYIIHQDLIAQLPFHKEEKVNILHIGCKSGGTLLQIKNQFKRAILYGMETIEHEAKEAELIANVIQGRETAMAQFPDVFFDAILITDWKQYEPNSLLKDVKRCLKKEGIFLGKMKNVSSYTNISKLIMAENPFNLGDTYFSKNEINELLGNEFYYKFINVQDSLTKDILAFIQNLCQMGSKDIADFAVRDFIVIANVKDEELKLYVNNIYEGKNIEGSIEKLLTYKDEEIILAAEEMDSSIEVLNALAITFYSYQHYEHVLPYLEAAFHLDSENKDTIYNIAFILHSFGENTSAIKYLELLIYMDNEALELYEQIAGKTRYDQQELMMLLRRIEYGIDFDQNFQDLNKILLETNVTSNDIITIIEKNIIHKVKVLNLIASARYQQGVYEDILVYLNKSYEIDKKNEHTLYNLGFILFKLGEHQAALNYFKKIQNPDEEIEQIIGEILKVV
ncbi:glycosyltransferase [Cytobacillus praedii]|uniref:glycosyltransferase n=1 Tax=Cytobacillus praedii TaxID=1742358 RepID=UPI002E20DDF1|nr:glycosyltransferase [Cytobacillus praedii]